MLKAYKYRIYPNKEQIIKITAHFGCCRYVYNWGLNRKMEEYEKTGKSISCFDLINELVTLKSELKWLRDSYSQSLQASLKNLDSAYRRFFREKKGFPKFKVKNNPIQTCQYPQGVKFRDNKVFIPKIGNIRIVMHHQFVGTVKTVTMSVSSTGKYYVSALIDDGMDYPLPCTYIAETTIGVDVGLKHFAVLSDGTKIEHPKHLVHAEKKLKRLQRNMSKRKKGSHNRSKARVHLALHHEKVTNKRKDFIHKLSKRLIDENQAVAIETLNVSGMMKNHKLAKHIGASGWSMFFTFLNYKARWYGGNVLEINQFDPSSKTCHVCGHINNDLKLKDRTWICQKCVTKHDRDENAAINIKAFALTQKSLTVLTDSQELTPVEIADYGGH